MIRKFILAALAALSLGCAGPVVAQPVEIVIQPVLVAPAPGYFLCYDLDGVVYTIDTPCVYPLTPYPVEWIGVHRPHWVPRPPVIVVRPPVVVHGPGPHHRR